MAGVYITLGVALIIGWHLWRKKIGAPEPQQKEEDRDRDYGAPW